MTSETRPPRLHRPHLFPFLFSLVTVTALLNANRGEGVRPGDLVVPTAMALLTVVLGLGVGSLASRDRTAQNLIALGITAITLASGYVFWWIESLGFVDSGAADLLQVTLSFVALVVIVAVCRRIVWDNRVPRFLNVMGGLLLAFGIPGLLDLVGGGDPILPEPVPLEIRAEYGKPDIFLVTLDAYSGAGALASNYGFDNTPFLDSLRARGFRIPGTSLVNYPSTFLSVGSMLNRRYADDVARAAAPAFRDRDPAYRALEFNQTVSDLKSFGYAFHYVGSSYPPMARNRNAEHSQKSLLASEFETVWMSKTLVLPVAAVYCVPRGCGARAIFASEDAEGTERRIADFLAAAEQSSPKFVYLHLMLPHRPFRFSPNCTHRPPVWEVEDEEIRRLYLDQLGCTNRLVLGIVDGLRAAADAEAVILLQADHGFGRFGARGPQRLSESRPDQVIERFDAFAAYAAPGDIADSLALVETPVNLFRTLFRVLWNADEPPLSDRQYWSDVGRPLDLFEVDVDSLRSLQ